jgi:hypothetical protein
VEDDPIPDLQQANGIDRGDSARQDVDVGTIGYQATG